MRAALVLWTWMNGALPEGYSRTLRHIDRDYRRRYCLPEADGFYWSGRSSRGSLRHHLGTWISTGFNNLNTDGKSKFPPSAAKTGLYL